MRAKGKGGETRRKRNVAKSGLRVTAHGDARQPPPPNRPRRGEGRRNATTGVSSKRDVVTDRRAGPTFSRSEWNIGITPDSPDSVEPSTRGFFPTGMRDTPGFPENPLTSGKSEGDPDMSRHIPFGTKRRSALPISVPATRRPIVVDRAAMLAARRDRSAAPRRGARIEMVKPIPEDTVQAAAPIWRRYPSGAPYHCSIICRAIEARPGSSSSPVATDRASSSRVNQRAELTSS